MRNNYGKILYIGKAKNLKRRVSSYFQQKQLDPKTKALVSQVANIDITITQTEKEALLLECNLIKTHKPRYNVCLKDDKSYPYLVLSDHKIPRLFASRHASKQKGQRFGPYPSMGSVRTTLALLQKIFKIRQCENSFFNNRTRPCLQYQIKRCSAPCVDYIDTDDYQCDVENLKLFLQGRAQDVLEKIARTMHEASQKLDFELAATLRDQLACLRQLQEQQFIDTQHEANIDVVAIVEKENHFASQVLMIRQGRLLGSRTYYPKVGLDESHASVLGAFLAQFYTGQLGALNLPHEVLLNETPENLALLSEALSIKFGRAPVFKTKLRSKRRKWMDMARLNAKEALLNTLLMDEHYKAKLLALQLRLNLKKMPKHMECFDISHTFGELPVASCVVFDHKGANKKAYRQFNINNITKGDDYAAIGDAVKRRYMRLKKEDKPMPDIIFIDGGKGQLSAAQKMLNELQLSDLLLIGVAKGPSRKAGLEVLWSNQLDQPLSLKEDDKALHLIQQIRDEAHRFALYAHRKKRSKKRQGSPIDHIPGIGSVKKTALLNYFGGWQEINKASIDEMCKVKGINQKLAKIIYETLQNLD